MAMATGTCFANPGLGQPNISAADVLPAQEACAKAAEANGFTVESIVSSTAETVTDELTRTTVVLALTKAGVPYTLTCPLTLPKESIGSTAVGTNDTVSSDDAQANSAITNSAVADDTVDQSDKAIMHFPSWWWLLVPLLGLLLLLWQLTRQRSASKPSLVAATQPEDEVDYPPKPQALAALVTAEPISDPNLLGILPVQPNPTSPEQLLRDFPMENSDSTPLSPPLVEEKVLSVIQEEMTVKTQEIARSKVRVNKRVETREEVVNVPLVHEQVLIEHIPLNQIIEGDIPLERDEGEVHIIPIFEEVATTETQLWLREEVHITKQRTTETAHQTVMLRREVTDVQRIALAGNVALERSPMPDRLVTESASQELAPVPAKLIAEAAEVGPSMAFPQSVSATTQTAATADETVNEIVIPIMAEEVTLDTQTIPRNRVRVHKRVEHREEVVEAPAIREELVIHHIPINQYVEGPPPMEREEGGVRIIPILEERVVSKTQLWLREEIHISKRRDMETVPQTITLRHEVVDVEEIDLENASSK
jgi:uncharacterized protein (TIGR02271 family)